MSGLLILVPTDFERQKLVPMFKECTSLEACSIEVCGLGPILAGIQTTRLLSRFHPARVLLLGIAGTYGKALGVGAAHEFSEVGCYGVGAGSGSEFQTAEQLGWSRWLQLETPSGEVLTLSDRESLGSQSGSLLLTCCAASSSVVDVQDRLRQFPEAEAEDMEAYAVAASCRLANIPLRVVRGISNVAGDREKSHWQIDGALKAVAELVKVGEFV